MRESIPVTAVVFNNGQWGAEKKNHVDFYANRFVGVNLDKQPSWAAVAQAMGAEGLRIDKLSDVGPALRAAATAQRDGKTTVLEMMVTRELGDPFRRDALACRRAISTSTSRPPIAEAVGSGRYTRAMLTEVDGARPSQAVRTPGMTPAATARAACRQRSSSAASSSC